MKKSARILFTVFVLIVSFNFTQQVFACQCDAFPPLYESYKRSQAVFIGKVTGSNYPKTREDFDGSDVIFDIEVIENFKGADSKQMKLNRGQANSSCYSGYTIGETYLFYAEKRTSFGGVYIDKTQNPNIVYQMSFCHRTSELERAKDQIYFIREMLKGKPEPQIYGSVGRTDLNSKTLDWYYSFLEGINIVLTNEKGEIKTTTDKNGVFKFNDVPAGNYTLKLLSETAFQPYYPQERNITILSNGNILNDNEEYYETYNNFYTEFNLSWNNSVDGKAVDSEGKPLYRFASELLPLVSADKKISTSMTGSPDHHIDGKFWASRRTPGKYVLAMDFYAPFENESKKRFYYPGTDSLEKAKIFDIEPATQINDLVFKIPFTARKVEAEFFWSDGQPVLNFGRVTLNKSESLDDESNVKFDWDQNDIGKFSIPVFEGFNYWVSALMNAEIYEDNREKRITIYSKPQKITVGKTDIKLKFVFEKPQNIIKVK